MKIRTNATSKKKKSSGKDEPSKGESEEKNSNYNIRQISNGWIVRKSCNDDKGNYKEEEIYYKENPIKDTQVA